MGLARELGVAGRLKILTEVDDLLAAYRRADIFVFPSLYEGFGYPLMEAMSQGIPILASSATCVPEVVGHGGRLLDPNHLPPWVEAVRSLAEPSRHREAQRTALSQSHEFTQERTGRGLERAYELVASR